MIRLFARQIAPSEDCRAVRHSPAPPSRRGPLAGIGAPFDLPLAPGVPGSPENPYSVTVVAPVKISNPVWNAMSLVVGIAAGYALGKVT